MTQADKQGWIRTILTIGSMVVAISGSFYYQKAEIESHIANKEIHLTYSQLSREFIPRYEYESAMNSIREELKYIRNRLDIIANMMMRLDSFHKDKKNTMADIYGLPNEKLYVRYIFKDETQE